MRLSKKRYSVLLLRPEYMTDGRTDTHYGVYKAHDAGDAVIQARATCAKADGCDNPEQYTALLVTAGWNHDLTPFVAGAIAWHARNEKEK